MNRTTDQTKVGRIYRTLSISLSIYGLLVNTPCLAIDFNSPNGEGKLTISPKLQFDSFNGSVCDRSVCADHKQQMRVGEVKLVGTFYTGLNSKISARVGVDLSEEEEESERIRTEIRENLFSNYFAESDSGGVPLASINYAFSKNNDQYGFGFAVAEPNTSRFGYSEVSFLSSKYSAFNDERIGYFEPVKKDQIILEFQNSYLQSLVGFGVGKQASSRVEFDYDLTFGLGRPGAWYRFELSQRQVSDEQTNESFLSNGLALNLHLSKSIKMNVEYSDNELGDYYGMQLGIAFSNKWDFVAGLTKFESLDSPDYPEASFPDSENVYTNIGFSYSDQILIFLEYNRLIQGGSSRLDQAIALGLQYSL